MNDTYLEERIPKRLALHGSGIDAHISVTKHGFSSLKGELSGHQIKRYSNNNQTPVTLKAPTNQQLSTVYKCILLMS